MNDNLNKYIQINEDLLSNLLGVTEILDGYLYKIYNVTSKDKIRSDIHITQNGLN